MKKPVNEVYYIQYLKEKGLVVELKKIINNLYGMELKEIKDEHILSEYLLAKRFDNEVTLIKNQKLNKKENQKAHDLLIMEVLTAYLENAKTINININLMNEKFGVFSNERGVYLGKKGVIIGDFALTEFLWKIDLRVLKSFFKRNHDITISFLMNLSGSTDLKHFVGIHSDYLFDEVLKAIPDNSLLIDKDFKYSLLIEMNEFIHIKYLAKKINTESLNKLLNKASGEREYYYDEEKDESLDSLAKIIRTDDFALSIRETNGFSCFFKEKNRHDSGYGYHDSMDNLHNLNSKSDFNELKKSTKKPFFVQLPSEHLNKKRLVNNFKNLYYLVEKMRETDYQMVLLISDKKNVRKNEAVVLEKEVLDHLAWSMKDSRGSFVVYNVLMLLKKISLNSFLGLSFLIKILCEKKDKTKKNFESRVRELNFQRKLNNDYLKILERMPAIHFDKIEEFVKEYPDVVDRNGKFTEDGLDLFEMNVLY